MEWSEDSAVLTLRDSSHPVRAFYKLNQLRMDNQLCDIEIKVRGATFAAHKAILASDSPRILNLLEGNRDSIVFDDPLLNAQAINTLFEFVYTSILQIAKSNVQPLCYAAKYLQMERIEKACCKFMSKNVPVDCVSYFRFARMHGYEGLEQQCCEFIASHLDVISVVEMTADEMAAVLRRESLALDADGFVRVTSQWIAHDYGTRAQDACTLFDSVRTPWLVGVSKELSCVMRQFPAGALDPERFFRAMRHRGTTTSKYLEPSRHARSITTQQDPEIRLEPKGPLYAQPRSSAKVDSPIVASGFVYSSSDETAVDPSQKILTTSTRATKPATNASPKTAISSTVDLPKTSAGDCISPPQDARVGGTGTVNRGHPPQQLGALANSHVSRPGLLAGNGNDVTGGDISPPKALGGPPKTSVRHTAGTTVSSLEVRDTALPPLLDSLVSTTPLTIIGNHIPIQEAVLVKSTDSIPWSHNSLGHIGAVGKTTSGHFTPVEGSSGHFTPVEIVEGSSGHFTPVEVVEGSSGHFTPVEVVEGSSGHFTPVEVVEGSSGHFTPAEISLKSSPIQSELGVSERVDSMVPTPKMLTATCSTDHIFPPETTPPMQSFPDHVTIPAAKLLQNSSNRATEQGRKQATEHLSISKSLAARSSVDVATKPEETTKKRSSDHISSSSECTVGIVYVAGGSTAASVTASVEKYDPNTCTWTQAPNLPKKRSHCALAYAGKKLYVLGGLGEFCIVTTVDIYDPQVGMWQEGPQMLKPKSNFGVAVLNGSIYCIGGSDGTGDLTSVEIYDVRSNRWRQGNSLAHPRSYIQAAVLDGAIYAVGGSKKTTRLATVERLGTNDAWETVAEMNTPRSRPAIGSHCGRLYAVGGYDGKAILRSAECYMPGRSRWTVIADMSVPRNSPGFAVVGSRVLVCGGYNGKVIVNSCESYDPEEDKWLPAPAMRTARCNFGTTVVPPVVTNTWL